MTFILQVKNLTIKKHASITQIILAILFFSVLQSCFDDSEKNTPLPQFIEVGEGTRSFDDVDPRLWVYFERFEDAATERGINFSLAAANVTGSIEDEPGHDSAGRCLQDTNGTLHYVSIREDFWAKASSTDKEILVFHELGHCYLQRDHEDATLEDGNCVSLMRAGSSFCNDNYFEDTRIYYLDELFEL
ncbi:MAG: hypothetical protein ACI94Y_000114 [Maribacter sp.]|jgi:hypothetical protein